MLTVFISNEAHLFRLCKCLHPFVMLAFLKPAKKKTQDQNKEMMNNPKLHLNGDKIWSNICDVLWSKYHIEQIIKALFFLAMCCIFIPTPLLWGKFLFKLVLQHDAKSGGGKEKLLNNYKRFHPSHCRLCFSIFDFYFILFIIIKHLSLPPCSRTVLF